MTARNNYLLKKYGITEDQYNDVLRDQNECCAVCRRHQSAFTIRLAVDHDHKSGEIRGLLCKYCNRYAVGRHRRESGASILLSAAEYLLRPAYTGWIAPPKLKRKKKRGKRKPRFSKNG